MAKDADELFADGWCMPARKCECDKREGDAVSWGKREPFSGLTEVKEGCDGLLMEKAVDARVLVLLERMLP